MVLLARAVVVVLGALVVRQGQPVRAEPRE
jgi:hypothetical protein